MTTRSHFKGTGTPLVIVPTSKIWENSDSIVHWNCNRIMKEKHKMCASRCLIIKGVESQRNLVFTENWKSVFHDTYMEWCWRSDFSFYSLPLSPLSKSTGLHQVSSKNINKKTKQKCFFFNAVLFKNTDTLKWSVLIMCVRLWILETFKYNCRWI